MKKSRIAIILASALMCLGFALSPVTAVAEDGAETPIESAKIVEGEEVIEDAESVENSAVLEDVECTIPETEDSKWFDEYIVPMLVQFGATLAAFAMGVVVFFKVLNKTKKAFEEATGLVNTSNNNNADIRAEMKQLKKDNEAWKKGVEKKLVAGVDDTNKTVHKILEVQELAHTSNPALVGNGTAKKISEVVRK